MGNVAVASVVALVTAAVVRRIMMHYKRKCPSKTLMAGKTVIITGANCGLGKATALELARRKAKIILACRTLDSAREAAQQIKFATGNSEIVPKELNLASLKSVKAFSQEVLAEVDKIDVLLNNAGVFQCPYTKTEDGFELQMGVNHFGHFALTLFLLDRIKQSSPSRIVIVSSGLSKNGSIQFEDIHSTQNYNKAKAYADSKLANLMFAQKLSKQLENTGVEVFPLNPGMVATNLGRHVVKPLVKSILTPIVVFLGLRNASEGCQTLVYCSVAEELKGKSGTYIERDFKPRDYPPKALDNTAIEDLWDLSKKLTNA